MDCVQRFTDITNSRTIVAGLEINVNLDYKTVHCCYGGIENDFDFFGPNWSLRHENLEKLIKTVA